MPKSIPFIAAFPDTRLVVTAVNSQPVVLYNEDPNAVLDIENNPIFRLYSVTVEMSLSTDHKFFVFTFFHNSPEMLRARANRMECDHLDGVHTCKAPL